jgi:hypothetical protein
MPRFKRAKLDVAASATGRESHPLKSSAFAAHFFASYRSKFLAVNAEMVVIAPKMTRPYKIAFTRNANDITGPFQCKASRKTPALSQSGGYDAAEKEILAISFPGTILQCITIPRRTLPRACRNITVIKMLTATKLAVNNGNVGMGEKNRLMYHAVPMSPQITLACRGE